MIPALFICHGSPRLALENHEYARFLQQLGQRIKPKAIVIFTAHWESEILSVSFRNKPYDTIYDFGGFEKELYSIRYPAPGSTEVAGVLLKRFEAHGIKTRIEEERGLDHGTWVVLRLMYPEADIPVVQLSVDPFLPLQEQFRIGRSLQGLGKEGILVIGSGGTVHNLRTINWHVKEPEPWVVEFDDWLVDKVIKSDMDSLFAYERLAPHAKRAVPREEHFVPLFLAMGSGEEGSVPQLLHRSYDYATLSHICFQF